MGTQVGTREKSGEAKGDHQLSTTSGTTIKSADASVPVFFPPDALTVRHYFQSPF